MIKIKSTFGNFCLIFAKINANETDNRERINEINKNELELYISIFGGSSDLTIDRYKNRMKNFGFISQGYNEYVFNINWEKICAAINLFLEVNQYNDPRIISFIKCFKEEKHKQKKKKPPVKNLKNNKK